MTYRMCIYHSTGEEFDILICFSLAQTVEGPFSTINMCVVEKSYFYFPNKCLHAHMQMETQEDSPYLCNTVECAI